MTAETAAGRRTRGRKIFAVILAIIAIAFIVVGIIYCVEPSGSLPAWLGHETVRVRGQELPSPTYRPLRAVGALIAGVVFGIGSWFSFAYKAATGTGAEAETHTEVTGVS